MILDLKLEERVELNSFVRSKSDIDVISKCVIRNGLNRIGKHDKGGDFIRMRE